MLHAIALYHREESLRTIAMRCHHPSSMPSATISFSRLLAADEVLSMSVHDYTIITMIRRPTWTCVCEGSKTHRARGLGVSVFVMQLINLRQSICKPVSF
jgi:hypothetical protein